MGALVCELVHQTVCVCVCDCRDRTRKADGGRDGIVVRDFSVTGNKKEIERELVAESMREQDVRCECLHVRRVKNGVQDSPSDVCRLFIICVLPCLCSSEFRRTRTTTQHRPAHQGAREWRLCVCTLGER